MKITTHHEHQEASQDPKTGRIRVRTINTEPSMAQQQFKDECDINNIMNKYLKTGEFTHATGKQGVYADFTEITDFQGMVDTIQKAEEAFALLPAQIRAKFQNNPGELVDFLGDPKNYDEALSLGLLDPKDLPTKIEANNNAIQRDEKMPQKNDKSKKQDPKPEE